MLRTGVIHLFKSHFDLRISTQSNFHLKISTLGFIFLTIDIHLIDFKVMLNAD